MWDAKPSYLPADRYAWKFEGYIYAPRTGTYQFGIDSDDASDVLINGNPVAYWYGGHGVDNSYRGGTVQLERGFHRIEMRFEEQTGGDGISVVWVPPGQDSSSFVNETYLYGE